MEAIVGVGGDKEATTFVRLEVQTDDEIVHAAILIEHDQWNGSNWLWLYMASLQSEVVSLRVCRITVR